MHLGIVLAGLCLGQDICRPARDDDYLDIVGFLEVRKDLFNIGLFHRAAVHADVERALLRICTGTEQA